MAAPPPLLCFGVIADIQYADAEDGYDFGGCRRRYYRQSLGLLRDAVEAWAAERPPLAFVLQLGDSIDGLNARRGAAEAALERVLAVLGRLPVPVHHAWGNHELYNFSRARLARSGLSAAVARPPGRDCQACHCSPAGDNQACHCSPAGDNQACHCSPAGDNQACHCSPAGDNQACHFSPAGDCQAYHFSPAVQVRVVVLDAYDLSILGREPDSPRYQESLQLLREKNPNDNLNSPAGLEEPQFVEFNGGFSQAQLDWFNEVLKFSDENQEKVVVMGHLPIHPDASDRVCLAWNYKDALSVIYSHRCVVCFLAGHLHDGGYCLDSHGVHHLTLEGVIETPPESNAFGTIYVYEDKMILKGRGRISDRVMHFRKW